MFIVVSARAQRILHMQGVEIEITATHDFDRKK
jgi:hypothetical protein